MAVRATLARVGGARSSMAGRLVAALLVIGIAADALAQSHQPDPDAVKAFESLVAATRARKPFQVKTSLVVEATEGKDASPSPAVEATLQFDPTTTPRRASLSLRGFDVLVRDGRLDVRHASNEREYVSIEDGGSPFYALLGEFMDLPYPQIGIVLGEDAAEDVLPQLNSRAGWIVPTRVETVAMVGDAEGAPGRTIRRIHITSDFEHMELDVDPQTHAIEQMRLNITGGPMVQNGASLRFTLKCVDTPLTDEELKTAFTFDPGERRRIDAIGALPRATDRAREGGGGGGVEMTMVGKPAPALSVARFDDGDFDLANFKGRKVVVIDFWATWCGPCRVGLPMLDSVTRRLTERGVPLAVVAINTLEGLEGEELRKKVGAFWADKNFAMTLAIDDAGEGADAFAVRALPTTIVIGIDGIVHWQHIGLSEKWEEELEAAIQAAMKPFPAADRTGVAPTPAPKVDEGDAPPARKSVEPEAPPAPKKP